MSATRVWIVPVFLLTATAFSAEWTQFRGPGGNAASEETGLPVKWGKSEGLRWKVELPGKGLSNPVIAAGRVYVTACSEYRQKRLHVICLDEATGKKLWERQFAATGNTACNQATNMAAPTPVTDGKAVYALFATGDTAAIDRDGTLLWYRSLVGDYPDITNQVGLASSPVLAGNVLLLPLENAGDSFAAGIDTHSGKNLWKVKRDRQINWATPLVIESGGRQAVLFQTAGELSALDPQTGAVRWTYKGGGASIPSPAYGEGLVFVPAGQTRALRPRQDGSAPEVVWEVKAITGGFASPVYHRGRVYGVSNVVLTCLNAADGKEAWKQRIEGPFDGSPVIGDGKLYAVNRKGRTFVVELGDAPKLLAKNDLDDTILATPAIANGRIYLRSDKYVYCVGGEPAK